MGLFNDVVSLAKAGWTPAQVKEILEAEKNSQELPEEAKKDLPEEETPEKEAEEIDYKSLYEDSQKKLKEAQKQNLKNDELKDDSLSIDEIIKSVSSKLI